MQNKTIPIRFFALSSGSFLHVAAQCPVCPHLAHFVLSIKEVLIHILGRAVLNRPMVPNFF